MFQDHAMKIESGHVLMENASIVGKDATDPRIVKMSQMKWVVVSFYWQICKQFVAMIVILYFIPLFNCLDGKVRAHLTVRAPGPTQCFETTLCCCVADV